MGGQGLHSSFVVGIRHSGWGGGLRRRKQKRMLWVSYQGWHKRQRTHLTAASDPCLATVLFTGLEQEMWPFPQKTTSGLHHLAAAVIDTAAVAQTYF